MFGQKKYLATELTAKQPVILLLVEQENPFVKRLGEFFANSGLDVRVVLLSAFKDQGQALKQYQTLQKNEIYKVLVVGGFQNNFIEKSEFFLQVLQALERGFVEEGRLFPVFFLLNYSTPVKPIDLKLNNYQAFWSRQDQFLNASLKKFPLAQFCLIEDYIDPGFDFSLKFNLIFSLFKQQLLFDDLGECYWQTQEGFFSNFKKIFFQGKVGEKIILRGQKKSTNSFLLNAQDLCNRYFVESYTITKLFIKSAKEKALLADFIKVYYPDNLIDKILDQKIRRLPLSLDLNLNVEPEDLLALQPPKISSDNVNNEEAQKKAKEPEESKLETLDKQTETKQLEEKAIVIKDEALKNKTEVKKTNTDINKKNDKSIDIDKKLQDIFRSEQKDRQEERFQKNLKGAGKIVKKSKYRRVSFYIGILLSSLGLLILIMFANFYLTQKLFEKDLISLMKNATSDAGQVQTINPNQIKYRFFKWQLDQYQKIIGEELFATAKNYWQIFEQIKEVEIIRESLKNEAFLLYQEILRTDVDLQARWTSFLAKKQEFYQQQQELNRLLDQPNPDILSQEKAEILANYKQVIIKENRVQQRSIQFLESLSELLLSPARSNIIILIQDSNELRSSGGFLVSLVALSFESSRLLNWQVYDVASLDAQIYGERLANEELKTLLVADRLRLRDANWPVNFYDAGTDISWFIEQSLNLKPDLIISLNSKEIYAFATPLFPITVNNFAIEQRNFYEELLRQENLNFSSFSQEFLNRLTSVSQPEIDHVFQQLTTALESREILLFSNNEQLQNVIKNNLWSGEILTTPCPSEFSKNGNTCFTDGIYQLENNVGLNKVNRLVSQEIQHSLGISEKFIRHKRVIELENLSRQNFWPEGNYQSYLKFYLPKDARLEKIALDGVDIQENVYRWFEEKDKKVLAYKLTVPVLTKVSLEIVYLIPHQLEPPFSYVFLDQKQPGIFNKNTKYKVLFAESFQAQLIAPQANYENKVIEFSNNNLDNFLFAVAF